MGTPESGVILDGLLRLLGVTPVEFIAHGGSPTRVVRTRHGDGRQIVVKLLVDRPGLVDGHDLCSFRLKPEQIRAVRAKTALGASGAYVDVLSVHEGPGWAAYTMPFCEGEDLGAGLRAGQPVDGFVAELQDIIRRMVVDGYTTSSVAATFDSVRRLHVDRFLRRGWLLQRYLPEGLWSAREFVVNGRACLAPLAVLDAFAERPELLRRLEPPRLWFPLHGDPNLRNVLVRRQGDGGFTLIDPRGSLQPWDVMYDLAKILFSLTVWDHAIRDGFVISSESVGRRHVYDVRLSGGFLPSYVEAARRFVSALEQIEDLGIVVEHDPAWRSRLLVAHAFHLLAEAACRLSDWRARGTPDVTGRTSPTVLAFGHYLFGALFLNAAYRALAAQGEIEPGDHLAVLT